MSLNTVTNHYTVSEKTRPLLQAVVSTSVDYS